MSDITTEQRDAAFDYLRESEDELKSAVYIYTELEKSKDIVFGECHDRTKGTVDERR